MKKYVTSSLCTALALLACAFTPCYAMNKKQQLAQSAGGAHVITGRSQRYVPPKIASRNQNNNGSSQGAPAKKPAIKPLENAYNILPSLVGMGNEIVGAVYVGGPNPLVQMGHNLLIQQQQKLKNN
ncbi:MAG TPA: hypothetical protein VGT41_06020 [Candidatus Babeliales bacterium]|nr:hypothetical protein [Candidatus Babeliales bacterium]